MTIIVINIYKNQSVCCLLAELSGIISAAGSVIYRGGGEKRLSIETENSRSEAHV